MIFYSQIFELYNGSCVVSVKKENDFASVELSEKNENIVLYNSGHPVDTIYADSEQEASKIASEKTGFTCIKSEKVA